MNFILLKLAPTFPPATREERELWLAVQVSSGYYVEILNTDPEFIQQFRSNPETIRQRNHFYRDDGFAIRIFKPVPVLVQYYRWVGNIAMDWDWGLSTQVSVNRPAFSVLTSKMPVTLRLNLIALVFYIPIGFTLGIIAALKKNSIADNLISFGVMVFISIPVFVTMTILLMVLGYQLDWLPTQFLAQDIANPWLQIKGLILPVLGLSFGTIAGLTRVTRAELSEVLTSEFVLLARTKGLTRPQAVVRHAMRNSMVPLVPGIIFSFVTLLSGSVVIERIYGIPGTGGVYLEALREGAIDYNVILVVTAFYTAIGLFAILLVDLSYGLVDPRIRMGGRK
jgi:oligopeptide transport system permease protein